MAIYTASVGISDIVSGLNQATINIYKRSTTAPTDSPLGDSTYTFSTQGLVFTTSNGWSTTVPTGAGLLYIKVASAVSNRSTDSIAENEWSGAIQSEGLDGVNTATVYLYKRNSSDTAPTDLSSSTTYTFETSILTGANNGWTQEIPEKGDDTHIWVITATAASNAATDTVLASEWAEPKVLAQDGIKGLNQATVNIYKRSSTVPNTSPAGASVYTFSTKGITFTTANGWSSAVPTGSDTLYVKVASAVNINDTDSIAENEWSGTIQSEGSEGAAGINSATVLLYRRNSSDTAPTDLSSTTSYNFLNKTLTGANNSWTQVIPDKGTNTHLWVISATAASNTTTDSIPASEWSTPQVFVEDGIPGTNGLNQATVNIYKRSSTVPNTSPAGASVYTFSTKGITFTTANGWSTAVPTGSDTLYVKVASAVSNTTTDSIASSEWSGAIQSEGTDGNNGEDGDNGVAGINSATVYLYRRNSSNTAPTDLSSTTTYTFATGNLTGVNNSWAQVIPSKGTSTRLWFIAATAASNASTDSIPASEWSAPQILSEDGANGGTGGAGPTGSRGSQQFVVTVASVNSASGGSALATSKSTSNPWQSAGSISATSAQGLRVSNWIKTVAPGYDGTLITNDAVTVYHTANQWAATRSYDGTNWITVAEVIDGNLLVAGSVSANRLIIGGSEGLTADTLGAASQTTLLDSREWSVGTSGSQTGFPQNGTSAENSIIIGEGPDGVTQALWQASGLDGNADGGWNSDVISIEHEKTYRSVVWVKRQSSNGSTYHGCRGSASTVNLSGTTNSNPYFKSGNPPAYDKWYLYVGIIHGSGFTGTPSTTISGVYDPETGAKVQTGVDFKNAVGITHQQQRVLFYYTTINGSKSWFARPRFELVDGREPTLTSLMNSAALNNSVITDNIFTTNTTTIDGGKITTGSITANEIQAGSITTDRLTLTSSSMTIAGNTINVAGAALNRSHYFSSGTTTIAVPYLASEMILTGCGAGGGHVQIYNHTNDFRYLAGAGGGAGCLDYSQTLSSSATHIRVVIGAGVSGGSGTATVVSQSTNGGASFSTLISLGGGGVSSSVGTSTNGTNGGSGGTPSVYVAGQTASGHDGVRGTVDEPKASTAMTGTGSTITDWPYGNAGVVTSSLSTPLPLGFGCGTSSSQGINRDHNQIGKYAATGAGGFMKISFGA